ncbi:MAG: hypothetical protein WBA46_12800 [Thermomicrobiales bacterium]
MDPLYLKALGLGFAGFDPSGALLAIAFLAAGASRKAVFLFGLAYLGGTITILSVASILLRTRVPGTGLRVLDHHPQTRAVVELIIGIVLIGVALCHTLHKNQSTTAKSRKLPIAPWATMGTGLLLAAGVVGEPALLAFTVVAATANATSTIIGTQVVAVLASKFPVLIVMIGVALGAESTVTTRLTTLWDRVAPAVSRLVTILLVGMAAVLIANALWWFRTDAFLLQALPPR